MSGWFKNPFSRKKDPIKFVDKQFVELQSSLHAARKIEKKEISLLRNANLDALRDMLHTLHADLMTYSKYVIYLDKAKKAALHKGISMANIGARKGYVTDEQREVNVWIAKLGEMREKVIIHVKKMHHILGKVFKAHKDMLEAGRYHGRVSNELQKSFRLKDESLTRAMVSCIDILNRFNRHLQEVALHVKELERTLTKDIYKVNFGELKSDLAEIKRLTRDFDTIMTEQNQLWGAEETALRVIDESIKSVENTRRRLSKIDRDTSPEAQIRVAEPHLAEYTGLR